MFWGKWYFHVIDVGNLNPNLLALSQLSLGDPCGDGSQNALASDSREAILHGIAGRTGKNCRRASVYFFLHVYELEEKRKEKEKNSTWHE